MIDDLRAILGEGPSDDTLQALLNQTGGDVSAAANRFFDGGPASAASAPYDTPPPPPCGGVSDDVMATLFKTLEDVGRKLAGAPASRPAKASPIVVWRVPTAQTENEPAPAFAHPILCRKPAPAFADPILRRESAERDQQLDTTTKVCEVLQRRLTELETALAVADANESERAEAQEELQAAQSAAAAAASSASGAAADSDGGIGSAITNGHLGPALLVLAGMPLHLLRLALPRVLMSPLGRLPMMRWLGRMVGVAPRPSLKRTRDDASEEGEDAAVARVVDEARDEDDDASDESDGEEGSEEDEENEGEDDGGEEEGEGEDDDEEEEGEDEDGEAEDDEARVAEIAAAVAASQAAAQEALQLPAELLKSISTWEEQQSAAEADWRQQQARLTAEFEERKRRLQERHMQERKKFRDNSDEALRPIYQEGSALCAQLEEVLGGKLCRFCEAAPGMFAAGSPAAAMQAQSHASTKRASGPLVRITGVTFGRIDAPIRTMHVSSRGANGTTVSSGLVVTLEKLVDRNGIAMLPPSEDPMLAFRSRSNTEVKLPLRVLGSMVQTLSDEETAAALPNGSIGETFVVRYAGGENGAPVEPVQILPEGLSLADYDISFAAGVSAMRVEHTTDGPVKCRAEPVARKQVFSETPLELYTQEIDESTHNIVQLYFSDLRDEVAIDVLNLTGRDLDLDDAECCAFHDDATGAALNYKILVRDARVVAVLYQEGGAIRSSPFVEHRLPLPGAYVTLSDGSLGVLGQLPRGLIVATEPRDLPEHPPRWAARPGLRAMGKHPAELPGMADVKIVQRDGAVAWPPEECAVPVCAIQAAAASRLGSWHAQWDEWLKGKTGAAEAKLASIEARLAETTKEGGGPSMVSDLAMLYSGLEELQLELTEAGAQPLDAERLTAVQRGIQRFAALARFS
jgi:hypothetical protein